MREVLDFNENWIFEGSEVRLPHSAVELPFNYFDEKTYQRQFVYEKTFSFESSWIGKEVYVVFEAAMANAQVFLNSVEIITHTDGYTPFEGRMTEHLQPGDNVLRVIIDGTENPSIPPFGGRMDFLTFAGLYREVFLRLTAPVFIDCLKVETPNVLAEKKSLKVVVSLSNPQRLRISGQMKVNLLNSEGESLADSTLDISSNMLSFELSGLTDILLWDVDNPKLYSLLLNIKTSNGEDIFTERFGFRSAQFLNEGFMLNGRLLKIRGLNRHQSYPYVGYALGKSAQVKDADILKYDLRLNLVRTSHYPQSKHFLNRCDEIGLLVFEEIAGWQHIGNQEWQAKSVENVRNMIKRDWNHPSIILWGVRINESPDNHAFYSETNKVARRLDPTRQTGGVRCHVESEFLEDVYTMNDFILGQEELGGNRGRTPLRPQRECTGLDHNVPYMVTEYNGHMFPTKSYDQEQRQNEHVLRHLEVLNAAYGAERTSGVIGWCAFDYNTHKDFGSGDRICYHGVMDMFREPKFASYVYASQDNPVNGVVLEPTTLWARGERNIEGVLPLIILTNCDEILFCLNEGAEPVLMKPDRESFPHLPYAPIIAKKEHFSEKVFGTWGTDWQDVTINGYIKGECVKRRKFVADPVPTKLEVVPDSKWINVGVDLRVMIRALDQVGNKLRHLLDPVSIEISGPAILFGPQNLPLRAGSVGFWLRATELGTIKISVRHSRFDDKILRIEVHK